MSIVGGLDVHRVQITYDYLEVETGEVEVGRIVPATRVELRDWLSRFDGENAVFATEGCTGWRFVVEELDRADARYLPRLLVENRIPESWIAPSHVLETRIRARLYVALMDERRAWRQRIQAQLFHQGVEKRRGLLTVTGRTRLDGAELSAAGRQLVEVAPADHRRPRCRSRPAAK